MHRVVGQFRLPESIATHRQRRREDRVAVEEVDEQSLAVARHGARREGGPLGPLGGETAGVNIGLPDLLPGPAIETQHRLHLTLLVSRRQINVISDDNWRTVPATGHRRLPQHVLRVAPLERRILIGTGNAIAIRSAPPRPVVITETGDRLRRLASHRFCRPSRRIESAEKTKQSSSRQKPSHEQSSALKKNIGRVNFETGLSPIAVHTQSDPGLTTQNRVGQPRARRAATQVHPHVVRLQPGHLGRSSD